MVINKTIIVSYWTLMLLHTHMMNTRFQISFIWLYNVIHFFKIMLHMVISIVENIVKTKGGLVN